MRERLERVLEVLERIPTRFASIHTPQDFTASSIGLEHMDSICMILIAVGEAFNQIDRKTGGEFLTRYPHIEWSGVIGVRNVLAHGYFDVDAAEIFGICKNDMPVLIDTVKKNDL
ncbi:MAG: DUF86 domain-containing protein [Magnetococcus sp. YQC-5]